ncbi:hypothetical protein CMK11_06475 [Candidatus Poribacteria bacterium]|nr:hypothetical protein [Candidatus Poribacteria bacterium]
MRAGRVDAAPEAAQAGKTSGPQLLISARSAAEFRNGLDVGHVLNGKVLQVFDQDTALVRFRGYNLVTQSSTPLNAGADIHAEITNLGDPITMKMLPTGGGLDNAAALLERLGLPATRANIEFIALMSRAGMPLTPENVQGMFQQLAGLPQGPNTPSALILAHLLDIPVSPATLEAIQALTDTQPQLGARLAEMTAQLGRAQAQIPAGQAPTLEALAQAIAALPVTPGEEVSAESVRQLLQNLGVGYERAVAEGAAAGTGLKGLLIGARAELAQQILIAQQQGRSAAAVAALATGIDGMLRQIDAYQILARIPALNLPHLYMQIPYWVPFATAPLTLTVQARKDEPTGDMDADNTEIEFAVRTRRWGLVHARLVIRDGRIRGAIEAETPEARDVISPRLDALIGRMERLGYSVVQMQALVAAIADVDEPVVRRIDLRESLFDMEV